MKRLKKILLAALAAALLLVCLPGTAAAGDDYDILSQDIRIVVSENNIASITETFVMDYKVPCHGFYYAVQYKGTGRYYDAGNEWCIAWYSQRIYNFEVQGYEFELSRETYEDGSAYLVAKIGSPDETVTGQQTYIITYQCDLGEDGDPSVDLFYRDLIRCEAGYTVENASFTVELPKDFDESLADVELGEAYATTASDLAWEKDGSTITGRALRPLEGGESITLRVDLPDGYFTDKDAKLSQDILALLILIAGI